MNSEDTLIVNYQDARSASSDPNSFLNRLRYRSWNYFLMTTPTHMIQFNFVDVISDAAGKKGFCPSNLMIIDRNDPKGSFLKVEEGTFTCAEYDRTSLFDFEMPPKLVGNGGKLQMSITRIQ